jgi:DNA repair exonuclease SbcCD ATPase subunit
VCSSDLTTLRGTLEDIRDKWDGKVETEAANRNYSLRTSNATEALAQAQASLATLDEADAAVQADLEHLAGEAEEAASAQRAVNARTEELAAAEETHREAKQKADEWAANLRAYEAARARIEQAKADLATWQETASKEAAEAAAYKTLAEAFHRDGIPTRILAGGIPLIEQEANRVLQGLPGDLSIHLRTERETQKGGISDTLDVIVTVDGWEREYGLLSVGMRFRVDLAIRLGLGRVLTHRTGGTIDTLWLDEPLAALDRDGQEAVSETLAALEDQFGLIIVVSHSPDFNDTFPQRIEIAMVDGVSSASLIA